MITHTAYNYSHIYSNIENYQTIHLETVDLDLFLLSDPSLNQKMRHFLPLITLELNDLPKLLVLHHVPVAAEVFLQILENLLVAVRFLQTLNSRQALFPIPLLDPDVDVLFGPWCI